MIFPAQEKKLLGKQSNGLRKTLWESMMVLTALEKLLSIQFPMRLCRSTSQALQPNKAAIWEYILQRLKSFLRLYPRVLKQRFILIIQKGVMEGVEAGIGLMKSRWCTDFMELLRLMVRYIKLRPLCGSIEIQIYLQQPIVMK